MIRLIPIYRVRDGINSVKRNREVFETCGNLLYSGRSILIFPEGNHDNKYMLRNLQKGTARIAFNSLQMTNNSLDLKIVPTGIQYEDYEETGSCVLVTFGTPIRVSDYYDDHKSNPQSTIRLLTERISEHVFCSSW